MPLRRMGVLLSWTAWDASEVQVRQDVTLSRPTSHRARMPQEDSTNSEMAPEMSRVTIAQDLRSSQQSPAMLNPRARGGHTNSTGPARAPMGLPQPGRKIISIANVPPNTARMVAAILP